MVVALGSYLEYRNKNVIVDFIESVRAKERSNWCVTQNNYIACLKSNAVAEIWQLAIHNFLKLLKMFVQA